MTHFDHERIPERVVHARGTGAYGYFECTDSLADVTTAAFLGEAGRRTPVFVRFSTVGGSRGSADTVRDVRGFATKFYTSEGNFDLVGNNMPVFFIQDAVKFPDFVHAVKPEPHNEIPQASSAHDSFWDFISLQTESAHMVMWLMSDRALPRSYRMMQGFGVHTFRFVDAKGRGTFVKWHWRPRLGTHSLDWDETQKIAGQGPRLQPARPLGEHRGGQLPRVGPRRPARAAGARDGLRLRPPRRDEDHPRGGGPAAGRRADGPRPQPEQLLRGDRAGGVPPGEPAARAST